MTDVDVETAMAGSNLKWLRDRTLLLTKHGSQAYGTATPTSDTDYKGIVVEPREYYVGMGPGFEQAEFHKPDAVLYSLRKFLRLAADCNPSIIEVLFTDERDWVLVPEAPPRGDAWTFRMFLSLGRLLDARQTFLSRKARWTFSGYAMSQLKRIRTHHRWLVSPPQEEPTRKAFGLPEKTVIPYDQLLAAEDVIRKEMASMYNLDLDLDEAGNVKLKSGLDALRSRLATLLGGKDAEERVVGKQLGYDTNFLLLLEHERAYKNARIEWEQYHNWKRTRNPERAALEAKHGYDTKHAMHLVRLMRMGAEILAGKGVVVKRPDADELLAIRAGAWSYETLFEWAQAQEQDMDRLYRESPLPHAPDRGALQALCMSIYELTDHPEEE